MRNRILGLLVGLSISMAVPAYAADESILLRIGNKLVRGIVNLGTGWLEVPKQIYQVTREEGVLLGLTRGPIDGVGMFVARTVGGAYEILTFPLPIPAYYQPMLHPDFVWLVEPAEAPAEQFEPTSAAIAMACEISHSKLGGRTNEAFQRNSKNPVEPADHFKR